MNRLSFERVLGVSMLLFLGQVAYANQQGFYGLTLSKTFSSIYIADQKLTVGEHVEIETIVQALESHQISYSVNNNFTYPFWSTDRTTAKLIRTKEAKITWLNELKVICNISVDTEGIQTEEGLSVGLNTQQVYEIFGQKGPPDVNALVFAEREQHSFMTYKSELGFVRWTSVYFVAGKVRLFTITFSEMAP